MKEAPTKGGLYRGNLKIDGQKVPVEVELLGADNVKKTFVARIIHVDKKWWNRMPADGILNIPARIFRVPGGGWVRIKTPSVFKERKEGDKPCWKGYEMIGMKMKDGREVPNCVPVNEGDGPCWKGYEMVGMKMKDGKEVPNCVPINETDLRDTDTEVDYGRINPAPQIEEYDVETVEEMRDFIKFIKEYTMQLNEAGCPCVFEAEYQGREVKLGKIMRGDVKKFKVYVKNDKGNVVKVNFGAKGMRIKKDNPERRKSFRARMNCDSPGPRWKARYWSCRTW